MAMPDKKYFPESDTVAMIADQLQARSYASQDSQALLDFLFHLKKSDPRIRVIVKDKDRNRGTNMTVQIEGRKRCVSYIDIVPSGIIVKIDRNGMPESHFHVTDSIYMHTGGDGVKLLLSANNWRTILADMLSAYSIDCPNTETSTGSKDNTSLKLPPITPTACDINEVYPGRSEIEVSRILRDTEIARRIKVQHEYRCQICGHRITLKDGSFYAEAHHIQPLGYPHNGPDVAGNIICVCPNHHAELDYFSIRLVYEKLTITKEHLIETKYIDYHNQWLDK